MPLRYKDTFSLYQLSQCNTFNAKIPFFHLYFSSPFLSAFICVPSLNPMLIDVYYKHRPLKIERKKYIDAKKILTREKTSDIINNVKLNHYVNQG